MNSLELEEASIRRAFNGAAASYDRVAALQRRVGDALLQGIGHVAPATIVDAGCGTGYFTAALARRFPQARLYALDVAPAMLQATRKRLSVPLLCGDMHHLPLAPGRVDLLCSNLMLQWCDRLDLAFAEARRCLASGGEFAFSTFGEQTLRELRQSFRDRHSHVNRFAGMDELRASLEQAGFKNVGLERTSETAHYRDATRLMHELKALGARNATTGRARGLTGKRGWQDMLANYEKLRTPAGLPATYELIYVTART